MIGAGYQRTHLELLSLAEEHTKSEFSWKNGVKCLSPDRVPTSDQSEKSLQIQLGVPTTLLDFICRSSRGGGGFLTGNVSGLGTAAAS